MPDELGRKPGDPENRLVQYKLIDTDPVTGEAVWAQIVALEPNSIGGGGGGGGLTDVQLRATPVPVSGTFWQATQPVSGPLTDAQLRAADVKITLDGESVPVTGIFWQATQPVNGSVTALDEDAANSTVTNVTGTGASIQILASNANRKGVMIYNDSGVTAYIKLDDSAASATSFTVKMVDQAYYEVPFKYTGEIRGLWASGDLRVTELS